VFRRRGRGLPDGHPVAVCGTAGPGVVICQWFDGRAQGGSCDHRIAGDVETKIIDTAALEDSIVHSLRGRIALHRAAGQSRSRRGRSSYRDSPRPSPRRGPTVISIPADIASANCGRAILPDQNPQRARLPPADADLQQLAEDDRRRETVAIFGGDGCRMLGRR